MWNIIVNTGKSPPEIIKKINAIDVNWVTPGITIVLGGYIQ